jgi:hypothetical protein
VAVSELCAATRQFRQYRKVTPNQGFLLFAPPSLDSPFSGYGIFHTLEFLIVDQDHRPAMCCVAVEGASLMLCDAVLQGLPRCSDVVGVISATENVEVCAH